MRDTVIEKGEFTASRKELCILFSDIVSFTNLCESNEAGKVSEMLNVYFEYWNSIINKYNGTVDKYIGDAVMVIFGLDDPQKACENSVQCALEAVSGWNALKALMANRNLPQPEGFGVGCHFGEMIIGDIGSNDRKNITVVGDAVNTASRLESFTRQVNRAIVITDSVFERLCAETQARFEKLGMVKVKGKAQEVPI